MLDLLSFRVPTCRPSGRRRPRKHALLMLAAAVLLITACGQVAAQDSGVVIGIVVDGPWEGNAAAIETFRFEILQLTRPEFDVSIPLDKVRVGSWTVASIREAVEATYDDPDVDIVLALGTNCGADVCTRASLPKPTVVPFLVDSAFDQIPFENGASGQHNLVYNSTAGTVRRDLQAFLEVVPFDTLGILAGPESLSAKTAPGDLIESVAQELGIEIRVVHVDDSVAAAVAALPPDIDAVYLLPLLSLPPGGLRQLIEAINARGLPSFSLFGRTEVEQGVLAGIGTADFIERAARRTALNVQSILLGQDAGTLPVAFSRGTRLTINMTTARRIGVYPDFSVLTTAELIGEDRVLERVLSLQDAVQEAVHSNRDLAAAERLVTAGEYAVQETRAPLLPQIGLQTQAVIIDEDRALFGTSEGTWNGGANVEQALVSEPLWAQRSIEKHLQEQRRWQRESVRLDVVQDAAIGFLEVLRAKTQERLEKDNLDLTLSNLELARLRVRVGSSSRSDVLRWQAEMSANRIAVINANAQRNLQEIQLNRLLDRPAEEPFDTRETGLDDPGLMHTHDRLRPYVSDPWSFKLFRSWMVQVALRQSPEIKQLDAAIAAQRRLLQSTNRSFWLPQFGLQADWTRLFEEWGANEGQRSVLGLDDTDWSIGVRGSLPLFEGGRRFSARARNNEELLRLRIERDALAQRVEQVLRASLHAAGAARAAIDLSRHAADATQENLELVTDSYSRGVTDILGLLDAQNAALLAEIKASNAIYDYLIQWMRVERAVGKFTFSSTQEEIDAFFAELDAWFDEARQP